MELATKTQRTDAEILVDFSFFIMLFTSVAFSHSFIGQAGIIFFCSVMYLFMLGRRKIHFSYYFIFSIAFILYNLFLIREGYSINAETSMKMTKTLMINWVFAFVLYSYLIIRNDMERVLNLFVKAAFMFTFLIVLISRGDILSTRLGINANLSIAGIIIEYNANSIAIISAFSYVISLYTLLLYKSKGNLLYIMINLFCALWFVIIILLTGSRKGLIMVILGTALLMFLLYPEKRTKNLLISVCVLFILYSALMNVPWLYTIAGSRFETMLNAVLGKPVEEGSLMSRLYYIHLGWEYFLQRPWTGYGLDCFRYLRYAYETYSHNNYIELLFSGGIIGFVLYYMPNLIMYKGIISLSRQAINVFKVGFVIFLVQQATEYASVTYFERIPLTILIIALACLKLANKMKKASNSLSV